MSSGVSPTARALLTLDLLHTRPGLTATDIAERLGVSERAARRYVATLRESGIAVESTRGPYGGYRLGRGSGLPPVVFSEHEALGLVMAVMESHPAAARSDEDPVGAALTKILRVLPTSVGSQAAALRTHASAAPDRGDEHPNPTITSALVAAVAERRRASIVYRSSNGSEWVTDVDPWAIVVRFGLWYLLCHSHRSDSVRTYRVDRIQSVTETEYRFTPPEPLDAVAVLEQHLGTGWTYPTRVVFDAPRHEVARWVGPAMGRLEDAGACCVLVGSTQNPQMYAEEWLAQVPFPFRVDEGPELRDAVAALASRLTAAVDAEV
jgi:predicted DNA-binding transcriptional regulator YafY